VWVESTAVGITAVSIPAAEIMGSATVSEHFPRQEISLIATTRFCKLFHSLFRTKTFKRTNFAVRFTGGAYIPAEGIFTTTKDMDEIVLRFGQAGRLCLSGAKYSGKYIDCTHASGQTRFSAQHPSNPETGEAIREYNEHVLLEIVE